MRGATVVSVSLAGPGGMRSHRATLATRVENRAMAIDRAVQYAFGRGADFDHQNAREPRPGQLVGTILTNSRPEGIPVVLEVTTNGEPRHG